MAPPPSPLLVTKARSLTRTRAEASPWISPDATATLAAGPAPARVTRPASAAIEALRASDPATVTSPPTSDSASPRGTSSTLRSTAIAPGVAPRKPNACGVGHGERAAGGVQGAEHRPVGKPQLVGGAGVERALHVQPRVRAEQDAGRVEQVEVGTRDVEASVPSIEERSPPVTRPITFLMPSGPVKVTLPLGLDVERGSCGTGCRPGVWPRSAPILMSPPRRLTRRPSVPSVATSAAAMRGVVPASAR